LRQITRMVELEPRLAEVTQTHVSRLYVPATDSTLVVLPAEPGALQGWNPSLAIVDELHVVTRQVWDAVSLAAGKRDRSLTLAAAEASVPMTRATRHNFSGCGWRRSPRSARRCFRICPQRRG
jgi:phage terminase large subunit-like protein